MIHYGLLRIEVQRSHDGAFAAYLVDLVQVSPIGNSVHVAVIIHGYGLKKIVIVVFSVLDKACQWHKLGDVSRLQIHRRQIGASHKPGESIHRLCLIIIRGRRETYAHPLSVVTLYNPHRTVFHIIGIQSF